jgi:hypothetical protein
MKRLISPRSIVLAACAMAAVWVASAQQPKRVDDNALKNAAKNGDEWLTNGRDYAEELLKKGDLVVCRGGENAPKGAPKQ